MAFTVGSMVKTFGVMSVGRGLIREYDNSQCFLKKLILKLVAKHRSRYPLSFDTSKPCDAFLQMGRRLRIIRVARMKLRKNFSQNLELYSSALQTQISLRLARPLWKRHCSVRQMLLSYIGFNDVSVPINISISSVYPNLFAGLGFKVQDLVQLDVSV